MCVQMNCGLFSVLFILCALIKGQLLPTLPNLLRPECNFNPNLSGGFVPRYPIVPSSIFRPQVPIFNPLQMNRNYPAGYVNGMQSTGMGFFPPLGAGFSSNYPMITPRRPTCQTTCVKPGCPPVSFPPYGYRGSGIYGLPRAYGNTSPSVPSIFEQPSVYGVNGPTRPDVMCKDQSIKCPYLASTGQCANSATIQGLCPESCGTGCSLVGSERYGNILPDYGLNTNYGLTSTNNYGFMPGYNNGLLGASSGADNFGLFNGLAGTGSTAYGNNLNYGTLDWLTKYYGRGLYTDGQGLEYYNSGGTRLKNPQNYFIKHKNHSKSKIPIDNNSQEAASNYLRRKANT